MNFLLIAGGMLVPLIIFAALAFANRKDLHRGPLERGIKDPETVVEWGRLEN